MGGAYAGTEHLLLSIVRDQQAAGCRSLQALGHTPEQIRATLREVLKESGEAEVR